MKLKDRILRFSVALTVAGIISSQIPVRGVSALAQDGYTIDDDDGSFLGLGVSGQDVVKGGVAALAAYGLVVAILDNKKDDDDGIQAPGPDGVTPTSPMFDAFGQDADFSTMSRAAEGAGLKGLLSDTNQKVTVFAPTNDAFAPVMANNADLMNQPDALKALLEYHIVDGEWSAEQLAQSAAASNDNFQLTNKFGGQTLTISATGGLKVNGIPIVKSTQTGNGWIHGISSILPGAPLPGGATAPPATPPATP